MPESELPQVVNGPVIEKPYNHSQYPYGYPAPIPPVQQGYPNGAYPSDGYPPTSAYPSSSHAGMQWSSQDGAYANDQPPSSSPPNGTVLGLRKRTFWLIFGPLIALLVIGLAVGLGVGIGTAHKDTRGTTSTTTNTSPTSTSTSSSTAAPTPVACPQANGTIYQGKGQAPFMVLCNIDYNGAAGTTDVGNMTEDSVEDCMSLCSGNSSCAAAGWGNFEGTDTCYMKGSLGAPNDAPNWFFVIKQH
ncbi:hypothetical protein F5B20DRAFT_433262 [Whalleya microplaca]|nr:hypothetical protein F5B20DRAFT_433262 [Whalleya microplaca]